MVTGNRKLLLLVALLFGLPALATLAFLKTSSRVELGDGAQPGGMVSGRVLGQDGVPAAAAEVAVARLVGNSIHEELARTRADAEGAFTLTLPPVEGRYLLRAHGATLREAFVEYGWLDAAGGRFDPPSPTIELQPGCSLSVEIVGPDKQPAGAGRFELTGKFSSGLLSGFATSHVQRAGPVLRGSFVVEGLPSMSARLRVELESGQRVDSVLELAEGPNRHRIEL